MAKGQQGVNAVTVWMIIFVALWLTSTVFLVILYTGQQDLVDESNRLRAAKSRLISGQEENSLELVKDAREGGPTVVGLIEEARKETAFLATGDEVDDAGTVRAKRDQIVTTIVDDKIVPNARRYQDAPLHGALTNLYQAFRTEHQLKTEAEQRAAELDSKVSSLIEDNAKQQELFEEKAKEFSSELQRAEANHATYRKDRDAAVAQLTAEFDSAKEALNNEVTQARSELNELKATMSELQERLTQREAKLGELMVGPGELTTARQPDGMILTAIAGEPVVYIDLGQSDRITLGLRFSVYNADNGIPSSGRAKAQIEVVSVHERSAACRVTRKAPGEVIVAGDLIANPVFSTERALNFVVFGEFDLDHDGRKDPDGVSVVSALIRDWGGSVSENIDALTDFVVLGRAPRRPRSQDRGGSLNARQRAIRDAWDAYQTATSTARNLAIPVMTQEVFLTFLGQDNRLARR